MDSPFLEDEDKDNLNLSISSRDVTPMVDDQALYHKDLTDSSLAEDFNNLFTLEKEPYVSLSSQDQKDPNEQTLVKCTLENEVAQLVPPYFEGVGISLVPILNS